LLSLRSGPRNLPQEFSVNLSGKARQAQFPSPPPNSHTAKNSDRQGSMQVFTVADITGVECVCLPPTSRINSLFVQPSPRRRPCAVPTVRRSSFRSALLWVSCCAGAGAGAVNVDAGAGRDNRLSSKQIGEWLIPFRQRNLHAAFESSTRLVVAVDYWWNRHHQSKTRYCQHLWLTPDLPS